MVKSPGGCHTISKTITQSSSLETFSDFPVLVLDRKLKTVKFIFLDLPQMFHSNISSHVMSWHRESIKGTRNWLLSPWLILTAGEWSGLEGNPCVSHAEDEPPYLKFCGLTWASSCFCKGQEAQFSLCIGSYIYLFKKIKKEFFLTLLHGMWDLSSPTWGIDLCPPTLEACSLYHWTTREVIRFLHFLMLVISLWV